MRGELPSFALVSDEVRTHELSGLIVSQRRAEHERNRKLSPPRVITSDGEIVAGGRAQDRDIVGRTVRRAATSHRPGHERSLVPSGS